MLKFRKGTLDQLSCLVVSGIRDSVDKQSPIHITAACPLLASNGSKQNDVDVTVFELAQTLLEGLMDSPRLCSRLRNRWPGLARGPGILLKGQRPVHGLAFAFRVFTPVAEGRGLMIVLSPEVLLTPKVDETVWLTKAQMTDLFQKSITVNFTHGWRIAQGCNYSEIPNSSNEEKPGGRMHSCFPETKAPGYRGTQWRSSKAGRMGKSQTLLLELTLRGTRPRVWRKLEVPDRYRLDQLHRMIQILFGWKDAHLHHFELGEVWYANLDLMDGFDYEDETVPLAEVLSDRKSFRYRYDFGDQWEVRGRVLERIAEDRDGPHCLDGGMAGPPEDCGGVRGFKRLKRALSDPDASWDVCLPPPAPPSYRPDTFSLEVINRRLQRSFGRKRGSVSPQATLSGYRLSSLNLAGAIVAALMERQPLTLDGLERRLREAGYPLPAGQVSLRKSIAKTETVRIRHDGAVELVPGPSLDQTLSWMAVRSEEGRRGPSPSTVEPPPLTGCVSRAELEDARPGGLFPTEMSLRRKLTLVVDSLGGQAPLADAARSLQELEGQAYPELEQPPLAALKGYDALEWRDGILMLLEGPTTESARAAFRKWTLPRRKRQAVRAASDENAKVRALESRERVLAEYQQARSLRAVVLAAVWGTDELGLVLLEPRDGRPLWFDDPDEALAALRDFDVLIGLDPRTGFEAMGCDLSDKIVVNLTPTFKSMPISYGRRKNLSTSQAVAMVTGQELSKNNLRQMIARGGWRQARPELEQEAENLRRYWRFGVIHGAVPRGDEWMPVQWNPRKDIELSDAVKWCVADQRPLELTLRDGRTGRFQPQLGEELPRYDSRYQSLRGVWCDSALPDSLELIGIEDCEYPYEVEPERILKAYW